MPCILDLLQCILHMAGSMSCSMACSQYLTYHMEPQQNHQRTGSTTRRASLCYNSAFEAMRAVHLMQAPRWL